MIVEDLEADSEVDVDAVEAVIEDEVVVVEEDEAAKTIKKHGFLAQNSADLSNLYILSPFPFPTFPLVKNQESGADLPLLIARQGVPDHRALPWGE